MSIYLIVCLHQWDVKKSGPWLSVKSLFTNSVFHFFLCSLNWWSVFSKEIHRTSDIPHHKIRIFPIANTCHQNCSLEPLLSGEKVNIRVETMGVMRRGHRGECVSHPVTLFISRDSAWHSGSAELRKASIVVELYSVVAMGVGV